MIAHTEIMKALYVTGGCTVNWGTNSYGSWIKNPFVVGLWMVGRNHQRPLRLAELRNHRDDGIQPRMGKLGQRLL